jgi:hypothetical protein
LPHPEREVSSLVLDELCSSFRSIPASIIWLILSEVLGTVNVKRYIEDEQGFLFGVAGYNVRL